MQHRDSYVTAADFQLLASSGINSVRLGVGYWIMADTQVRSALRRSNRPSIGLVSMMAPCC